MYFFVAPKLKYNKLFCKKRNIFINNDVCSFHLSRSSSDPTVVLSLIQRQLLMPPSSPPTSETHSSDKEKSNEETLNDVPATPDPILSDPLPKKLRDTVNARLKSDGFICVIVAVVTVLLVSGEKVVHGEVHVKVGPLELPDDEGSGPALQHTLSLDIIKKRLS